MRRPAQVLLLAIGLIALACISPAPDAATTDSRPPPTESATPTRTAPPSASAPTSSPTPGLEGGFPSESLGLPVLSVERARDLLSEGRLDGRAVAIGGYWVEGMPMGCPRPLIDIVLQDHCVLREFLESDVEVASYSEDGAGGSTYSCCNVPPGVSALVPFMVAETSGAQSIGSGRSTVQDPSTSQRVVVIGHAADVRLWQCVPMERERCARELVIDRVAWVDGEEVELDSPYNELGARMQIDEVLESAAVTRADALTAFVVRAGSMWATEPRIDAAGTDIIWLVRALASDPDQDGTVAVSQTFIDDATGEVFGSVPLEVEPSYNPARLIVIVYDERTPSGGEWGYARFGLSGPHGELFPESGAGHMPFVLQPARLSLTGFISEATDETTEPCETQIDLVAGADVAYEVVFRPSGSCRWTADEAPAN